MPKQYQSYSWPDYAGNTTTGCHPDRSAAQPRGTEELRPGLVPNMEIKRCSDVVGVFPNEAAITRLIGAVILEQSEEWQVGRCYMAKHSLAVLQDDPEHEVEPQ